MLVVVEGARERAPGLHLIEGHQECLGVLDQDGMASPGEGVPSPEGRGLSWDQCSSWDQCPPWLGREQQGSQWQLYLEAAAPSSVRLSQNSPRDTARFQRESIQAKRLRLGVTPTPGRPSSHPFLL